MGIKIVAHRKNYRRNLQVFDITGQTEALDTAGGGGRQRHIFDSLHGFGHGWQGYHNRKAIKKGMIRRLTPTECERLQGFPDGWTEGISDTQRYKCLGNAVTTNVITAIGSYL